MKIIEKDCKIEHNGDCFVLYFLKTKKELKEDSEDTYKVHGYFSNVFNALMQILKWRMSEKYPFKESPHELRKYLRGYRQSEERLKESSEKIYQSIFDLKKEVFDGNRRFRDTN